MLTLKIQQRPQNGRLIIEVPKELEGNLFEVDITISNLQELMEQEDTEAEQFIAKCKGSAKYIHYIVNENELYEQ